MCAKTMRTRAKNENQLEVLQTQMHNYDKTCTSTHFAQSNVNIMWWIVIMKIEFCFSFRFTFFLLFSWHMKTDFIVYIISNMMMLEKRTSKGRNIASGKWKKKQKIFPFFFILCSATIGGMQTDSRDRAWMCLVKATLNGESGKNLIMQM